MSTTKKNPESLREFLRARRPERFSDTIMDSTPTLDRSLLEYHLDTLTNRNQELQFEEFARALAEREICPNLLPQTGPMGGGDSKADTETYPISDMLVLRWFSGIGREASSERWAFAMSTKKDWKTKVKSDVAGIVEANRDYRKIFFVSSRFIKSKLRANTEDELTRKYRLEVRILDRTWILDKIFTNRREALAIEKLGLAITPSSIVIRGSRDIERERALSTIEGQIASTLEQGRCDYQLVIDSLRAADLARSLELPRSDVEGRYERAERISERCGTPHYVCRCVYEKAWTAYWWYQDFEQFLTLYARLEQLVQGSLNVYDIEFIFNLHLLLQAATNDEFISTHRAQFDAHSKLLFAELSRLTEDSARTSTSLQARTLMLLSNLSRTDDRSEKTRLLRELRDVIARCEGLAGYPFESFVPILLEMQPLHEGDPAYGELFDLVVQLTSKREGEVRAGELLLNRGTAQFFQERPYESIRTLGKGSTLLFKDESRDSAIRALYICGCAYERVALLWAARGSLLNAASLCLGRTATHGEISTRHVALFNRLKWIELQLGRIPQAITWHELELGTHAALGSKNSAQYVQDSVEFDATLGVLFLRTNLWDLRRLTKFPSVLARLGLHGAGLALLYALGYEDETLDDEKISDLWGEGHPKTIFEEWEGAPAFTELPHEPEFYEEKMVRLKSRMLGCKVLVECLNRVPCVEFSETLLAALESVLSTCLDSSVVSREPRLTFFISHSELVTYPFEYEFRLVAGRPYFSVTISSFDPHTLTPDEQTALKSKLLELLIAAFGRIIVTKDSPRLFGERLWNESAVQRSIDFTGTFVTVGNIFGGVQPRSLFKWIEAGDAEFPVRRNIEPRRHFSSATSSDAATPRFAEDDSDPPVDLNLSEAKHTDLETHSLISEPLWENAKWWATVLAVPVQEGGLPILAPAFQDRAAAIDIFSAWQAELGKDDDLGLLRISIIQGIDKSNPNAYRVIIGSNPKVLDRNRAKFGIFVSRINTMTPFSSENLLRFINSYTKTGQYLLMPAFLAHPTSSFELIPTHAILKRDLNLRHAWEIARHDADAVGVYEDDRPVIPNIHFEDAPVNALLHWKKARSR